MPMSGAGLRLNHFFTLIKHPGILRKTGISSARGWSREATRLAARIDISRTFLGRLGLLGQRSVLKLYIAQALLTYPEKLAEYEEHFSRGAIKVVDLEIISDTEQVGAILKERHQAGKSFYTELFCVPGPFIVSVGLERYIKVPVHPFSLKTKNEPYSTE